MPKPRTLTILNAELSAAELAINLQEARQFRLNDGTLTVDGDQIILEDGRPAVLARPTADGTLELIELGPGAVVPRPKPRAVVPRPKLVIRADGDTGSEIEMGEGSTLEDAIQDCLADLRIYAKHHVAEGKSYAIFDEYDDLVAGVTCGGRGKVEIVTFEEVRTVNLDGTAVEDDDDD